MKNSFRTTIFNVSSIQIPLRRTEETGMSNVTTMKPEEKWEHVSDKKVIRTKANETTWNWDALDTRHMHRLKKGMGTMGRRQADSSKMPGGDWVSQRNTLLQRCCLTELWEKRLFICCQIWITYLILNVSIINYKSQSTKHEKLRSTSWLKRSLCNWFRLLTI